MAFRRTVEEGQGDVCSVLSSELVHIYDCACEVVHPY